MSKPHFSWEKEWVCAGSHIRLSGGQAFSLLYYKPLAVHSSWFSPAWWGFGWTKMGECHTSLFQGPEIHFHLLLIFTLTCWIARLRSLTGYALGQDLGYILQEEGWPCNLSQWPESVFLLFQNMIEECDTTAVTSLIQSYLPEAYLKEDIGGELVYVLPPFKSTVSGAYQALLRALDSSLNDLHLGCYGISNTTVEEVWAQELLGLRKCHRG